MIEVNDMLKSIEGVYRNGKIELSEQPTDIVDETRVIVTFLEPKSIDEQQAADLRARLESFAEDWESPEMNIYDDYDAAKSEL